MESNRLKDLMTMNHDKNTRFSDIIKDITPLEETKEYCEDDIKYVKTALDETYIYGTTKIAESLGIKISLMKSIVENYNVNNIELPLEKGKYKNGSTYRISIDDIDTAKRIIAEKYSFDNYVYGKETIIKELNLDITVKEFIDYIQENNLTEYITKRVAPKGGYTYALKKEDISKVKDILLEIKKGKDFNCALNSLLKLVVNNESKEESKEAKKSENREEEIVESKKDTVIEDDSVEEEESTKSEIENISISETNRLIESKINMPHIEGFEYIANVLVVDMPTLKKYVDMNLLPDIYVIKENGNYVYRLDFDKIQKCKDIISSLAGKDIKNEKYIEKESDSTDKPKAYPIRNIIFNRLNHVEKVSNEDINKGYSKETNSIEKVEEKTESIVKEKNTETVIVNSIEEVVEDNIKEEIAENVETEKEEQYETVSTNEVDKRIYLQQKHDDLLETIEKNNLTDLDYIQSSFYLLVSGRDFANIMRSVKRKDNNRYDITDLDNALYLRRTNGDEKYYFRTDICKLLNITGGQYASLCSNGILNPDKKIEIKLNCYINLYKESTVEYLRTYLKNIDKDKLVEYKNEIESARYIGIDAKEINRFLSEYNLKPTYMESFDRTKGSYNPIIMWFSKESLIFLHGLCSKRYLRENFNTQLRNDTNNHFKKINTDENYMQKCQILNAYKIPEEVYVFAVTHGFMKPDKVDDKGRAGKLYLFYPKTVENFIKRYKKENLGLQYGFTWMPE